jgi:putative transposase
MLIRKGFKYRIYPTPEQAARLTRWEGALRWLWNLGLEQWHLWMNGHVPVKYQRADHLLKADRVTDADIPPLTDAEWEQIEWSHSRHPDARRFDRSQHAIGCRNPDCKRQCLAGDPAAPRTRTLTPIYPNVFEQHRGVTELRAALPWLEDVPRNVCSNVLVQLELAWQRCFKKLAGEPHWKRKDRGNVPMCETHPKQWRLDGSVLRFPKLGNLRAVVHRPLEGRPKTCSITRDGDQWFACITCEIEVADPALRVEPVVAIDRGVINLVADSDGRILPNHANLQRSLMKLARAQRVAARRKKGSNNHRKAEARVSRIHRKTRRQREHLLHVLSADYAKSHGTVIVEKLQIQNMVRSAKGTKERPGKNVRAKSALNRRILDAGWGKFASMLRYKTAWRGGQVVEVPAAYSSQECHACHHVAAENRPDQATFSCVNCGLVEHADTNAALVLKSRWNPSALPGEASGSPSRRPRKSLRSPRRKQSEHPVLHGTG